MKQSRMIGLLMNYELERCGRKRWLTNLRHCPVILLEGLKRVTEPGPGRGVGYWCLF
jgi:hypothetical protein